MLGPDRQSSDQIQKRVALAGAVAVHLQCGPELTGGDNRRKARDCPYGF